MDKSQIRQDLEIAAGKRLKCYQELVALSSEQQLLLVNGDDSGLAENIAKHEPVLAHIARLDDQEAALIKQLREAEGVDDQTPYLGPAYSAIIKGTQAVADRLRELIRANSHLLQNAMEFVAFSVGIISQLATEQQGYGLTSQNKSSLSVALDTKV